MERKTQSMHETQGWFEGGSVLWASDLEKGAALLCRNFPNASSQALFMATKMKLSRSVEMTDYAIKRMMK